jgi:hypothetical protein
MPMHPRLDAHLGRRLAEEKDAAVRAETMACPPVQPMLTAHLRKRFQPSATIKPDHPQLQQLLLIQHGVELVLRYLEGQYDLQSAEARKVYER